MSKVYRGKLLREKTFTKLVEKYDFHGENFVDCSPIPSKDATPPNFTEIIFANSSKFVKVFSLKSFPLYSVQLFTFAR